MAHIFMCLRKNTIVSLPLHFSEANVKQLCTAQFWSMLSHGGSPHPANAPLLRVDRKGLPGARHHTGVQQPLSQLHYRPQWQQGQPHQILWFFCLFVHFCVVCLFVFPTRIHAEFVPLMKITFQNIESTEAGGQGPTRTRPGCAHSDSPI